MPLKQGNALSGVARPREPREDQPLERLKYRGPRREGGVAAGALLEAAVLRLASRNPGEPSIKGQFTQLLGSTSCGHRPVQRASPVNPMYQPLITTAVFEAVSYVCQYFALDGPHWTMSATASLVSAAIYRCQPQRDIASPGEQET